MRLLRFDRNLGTFCSLALASVEPVVRSELYDSKKVSKLGHEIRAYVEVKIIHSMSMRSNKNDIKEEEERGGGEKEEERGRRKRRGGGEEPENRRRAVGKEPGKRRGAGEKPERRT